MATLKGKGKGARAAASAAAAGGGGGANGSSSANAVQGPDNMGLEMYSSTLSRLVEATANTNEVPDDAVIAQVQQDLEALIAQAQQNVAECNARIAKLKRTSALIREEDAKRQRLDSAGIEDGTGESGAGGGGDSTTVKNEEGVDTDLTGLQTERRASGDGQTEQYEKNPKSEFVEAQDLPIAALGLFDESVNGLPENGEEYLKKKYAVASYPTKDLKDLLPGEIPDDDFTRAKPPNQVQFATYAQWLEPYFRLYTEEDISFLKQKGVGLDGDYARAILSPYMIPPLGPLYTQVWAEEDRPNPGYSISPATDATHAGDLKPRGTEADLSGDVLETDSVSCGPLASRLLSALLNEDGPAPASGGDSGGGDDDDDDDDSKQNGFNADAYKVRAQRADFESLEDRLKREFRYVGILDIGALRREDKRNRQFKLAAPAAGDADGYDIDWVNGTEDDEICFEIRALQKKFRQVSKMNQAYKQRLLPVVQEQMAWQEYSQILEDLDKQVDQAYLRRQRNPKTKKKKNAAAAASTAADKAANDRPGLKALLDKRQRWIEKVGPVFRPSQQMRRTPSESIFKDLHVDEDDDDVDPDDDEDMYTMSL